MEKQHKPSRRKFLKMTTAISGLSLMPFSIDAFGGFNPEGMMPETESAKSIIGVYGPWANGLLKDPPKLSLRNDKWNDVEKWRVKAMEKAEELVMQPDIREVNPKVTVHKKYEYDGLDIEELSWQLPYGAPTRAILLKPKGAKGRLPAVLGLHDHGGKKYFGRRKITKTSDDQHPMMKEHQEYYYEGRAWANEIARRGYVVLVNDAFTFGSRRVLFKNMSDIPWGDCATKGLSDDDPENAKNIDIYNKWAGTHEHIMAKSLFCAGTTWPGVFLAEDRVALDILSARDDVDKGRIGCAGLSGGGLRTVYLGGLDHRIKCAAAVGFMSTWTDFLLNKSYTHTWMTYTPVLPNFLDFPEILGLRVPLPTMTLNNREDGLFTLPEMQRADKILQDVFAKAKASDHYKGNFYDGPHKFDVKMQEDAFQWFDQWLK